MTGDLIEQIEANFNKVAAEPWRGKDSLWLTFYLGGQPEDLARLSRVFASSDWVNLSGSEGGFLYPKIEVQRTRDAIVAAATAAQAICAEHGAEIIAIDADISLEAERSPFVNLYEAADPLEIKRAV